MNEKERWCISGPLSAIHAWLCPYVCVHLAICSEGGSSAWGAPGLLPGFGLLLGPDVAFIPQPAVTWPLVGGACACHPLQPVYLFCHLQYPSAFTDNTINNWKEFWNECIFSTLFHGFILLSLTLSVFALHSTGFPSEAAMCEWALVMCFFALFGVFAAEFRHIDFHKLTVQKKGMKTASNANGVWTLQEIHWGRAGKLWLW